MKNMMPPTRGHDLKRKMEYSHSKSKPDAPHTGARLETSSRKFIPSRLSRMPPTRGHDLKR